MGNAEKRPGEELGQNQPPQQMVKRPEHLSDAELLSHLLFSPVITATRMSARRIDAHGIDDPPIEERGFDGCTMRCSDSLLGKYGGLRGLYISSRLPADQRFGLDDSIANRMLVAHELVQRTLKQSLQRGASLTSPAMTIQYLQTVLKDRKREIFTCLFLDTRHRVIASENLFKGSIDGACVYPRVVAERALRLSAAAVIVAHNHPSGVSEPSLADQAITRRLKDALLLLEIRLLDHFVVGDGPPVSMASRGML